MVVARTDEAVVLPPWTVEGHKNSRAWYMSMHERGPVQRDERSGVWMFVGWEAVREFLSQPRLWSTAARNDSIDESLRLIRLLTSDPPIHRQLRSYFSRAYTPDRIKMIEERTRQVSEELMSACLAKGTFDAVTDYSKTLAIITICELIGIPKKEDGRILGPIGQISGYLGSLAAAKDDPSVLELLNRGTTIPQTMELIGSFFAELIEKRRAQPSDDLVSDLTAIRPGEMNGLIDISALLFEQFGAGTNTTVHLFVSLVHELYVQPDLHRRVRKDRSLVSPLIEETLRLHAPIQARPRVLTEDTTINGELVKKGTWALGWIGAANIDPSVFPDPLKFDIDRPRNDHVSFGRSEHFCLGSHLAKMEVRVALNVWLDHVESYEPLSGREVEWAPDFILHGADNFPVRVIRQVS